MKKALTPAARDYINNCWLAGVRLSEVECDLRYSGPLYGGNDDALSRKLLEIWQPTTEQWDKGRKK